MTASTREAKGLADRRALAAAGAATVALSASALAAEPAQAEYTKQICGETGYRLCLWSDGGFNNNWHRWQINTSDQYYSNNAYSGIYKSTEWGLNDSVSAVWNLSPNYAMLFRDSSFASNRLCMPPWTGVRDLHQVKLANGPIVGPGSGDNWGNRISSHMMYTYKPSDCNASGSTMVPASEKGCSI